jgi:hypothetical protein
MRLRQLEKLDPRATRLLDADPDVECEQWAPRRRNADSRARRTARLPELEFERESGRDRGHRGENPRQR